MLEPRHVMRLALATLFAVGQTSAYAAEAVVDASLERVQETLYSTLEARQFVVLDDAQTDRFALVYAQTPAGGRLSISVRQLASPDRTRVNVTSDSPADPALDQALLDALRADP